MSDVWSEQGRPRFSPMQRKLYEAMRDDGVVDVPQLFDRLWPGRGVVGVRYMHQRLGPVIHRTNIKLSEARIHERIKVGRVPNTYELVCE